MNILVVSPSWVGDTVMMQPFVARLKLRLPHCKITVMAPSWSRGLLTRLPGVDETLENPFPHGALKLGERRRLGRQLRRRFDRCYVLPNSLKSALVPWFADIAERIGYLGEFRYGLLTDARKLDEVALPLMVERFAALADDRGSPLQRPVPHPVLSSSEAQQAAVLNKLGLSTAKPALALCPGAEYGPAKRWPTAHFATTARAALDRGWQVWLLGSHKDAALAEEIETAAPGSMNLCGKTTLEDVIDLLALSRHAITNDSGLMHIAAAVGTSLTAIYGSSSPGFTPPLSEHAVIQSLELACSPCFKRECPLGHTHCLTQLQPERVLKQIEL